MGRSGVPIIIMLFRYNADDGMPHSAIFQDNSIKVLESYPGARYSAVRRSAPGKPLFVHCALRDSVLNAGRPFPLFSNAQRRGVLPLKNGF